MKLPPKIAIRQAIKPRERRRFQRVKVDLAGRYMLSDKNEYRLSVHRHVARRRAAERAADRPGRRACDRLYRPYRPARGQDRPHLRARGFAMTIEASHAQARQAGRPAHLACQPRSPEPAGRPPARARAAEEPGQPNHHAGRARLSLQDPRSVAVGRRRDSGYPPGTRQRS